MSLLLPNTPEKEGAESSSVQSVPFSVPDSFNAQLSDNFNMASSVLCGEGSSWPKRDVNSNELFNHSTFFRVSEFYCDNTDMNIRT